MLNIAFLLACTGFPVPAVTTCVSGLVTLTALVTLTCGSAPNVPLTETPSILSPESTCDLPELEPASALLLPESLPPQAAVVSRRDATIRASRRRTERTPRWKVEDAEPPR